MNAQTSPLVFALEWVAEQRRRYESRPEFQRPEAYPLWTTDRCQPLRSRIESWVGQLSLDQQEKVIPRLRDGAQFQQTHNELAVGDSLRRSGCEIDYEPEMDGLTPDWLVRRPDIDFQFVVEVVSSNPSEARRRCEKEWADLRLRIEALPGCACLMMRLPLATCNEMPPPPDVAGRRQIVREIKMWLDSGPEPGARQVYEGIEFTFVGPLATRPGVSCGISSTPFWVTTEPLADAVKEKAKKYKGVVTARQLPFVVCVVPDFGTGRGIDELRDAVLGKQKCRVRIRPGTEDVIDHYRERDGLFGRYPSLSAVMMTEWQTHGFAQTLLLNPCAASPLPNSAIPDALVEEYGEGE